MGCGVYGIKYFWAVKRGFSKLIIDPNFDYFWSNVKNV